MSPQYVLHIGQQKSGTTYLQTVLTRCGVERLRSIGLCYPLAPVADAPDINQQYAMFGLLGRDEFDWVSPQWAEMQRPAWTAIANEARAWDGPVLLSAEALSVIRIDGIRKLHDALGNPSDVTILITTRNLGATLASSWQQHVRNGHNSSFEEYLDRLRDDRARFDVDLETAPDMGFWRSYAVGRLARRWAGVFGPENVRVVTSPGQPIDLLWARFCEALSVRGLADLPDPQDVARAVHTSLTAPEAAVLREVNTEFAQFRLADSAASTLRSLLIRELRARDDRGTRITVPDSYRDAVVAWSTEDLAELDGMDVKVYGRLDDICYRPAPETVINLSAEATARAAGAAVAAMLRRTPAPAHARPFHRVMRGFLGKWRRDIKRWALARWRAFTVVVVFAALIRPPSRQPSGDGYTAQMFDSVFGSVHDSFQAVFSAGYG